tara:strand:- start:259 stop:954 length:696 start_codon:yes stop_codon:yes gene_type:complete
MSIRRRQLLNASSAFTLAALLRPRPAAAIETGFCTPDDPLQKLMDGNRRFRSAWQAAKRDPEANLSRTDHLQRCFNPPLALAEGQQPWATVLTCSDSRVSPNWVFDTTPGELFVIRSAGNTAFTEAVASIEYSVSVLNTPLVMVMGHSGCGAVQAAMNDASLTPSLEQLVAPIRQQIDGTSSLAEAVKRNALGAAEQLLQHSDALRLAKADGAMKLVVSCFDLTSGAVSLI